MRNQTPKPTALEVFGSMPAEIALINQAIMDQGTPMTNDKKTNRMRGGKSPFDNLTVEYNATFPRTYKAKMDFFAEYLPKPEPTPQEMSPRQVKVKFAFLTVGDVDTKSQRFVTEVLIQAKWVEPKLQGLTDASQVENMSDLWDPKLKIQNLEEIKGGRDEKWHTIKLGDKDPIVIYRRRLKGSFYENMELKDFPRDVQDISVILRSELPTSEIEFVPDPEELSTVETSTFQDKQEWSMYRHVEVSTKLPETDDDDNAEENPFLNIPIITATARVARKSNFFFWNAILIMMCIVTLSFCGFALDFKDVKFRIAGNLTLLLTSVAFKLSVNQHLPMIPYLTGLDIYLIFSMMFLCFMTILFAFLSVIKEEPEKAKKADTICLLILIPFQLLFHIIFGIVFFRKTNKRRKEMQLKDNEYVLQKKQVAKSESTHSFSFVSAIDWNKQELQTNKRRKEMQLKDNEYVLQKKQVAKSESTHSFSFVSATDWNKQKLQREKDVKDRVRKETKLGVHGPNGLAVVNNNNNNNTNSPTGASEV